MVSHISPWHSRYLEFQTRSTSLLQYRGRDRLYVGSERVSGFPIPRARRIFPCHRREKREMNAARDRASDSCFLSCVESLLRVLSLPQVRFLRYAPSVRDRWRRGGRGTGAIKYDKSEKGAAISRRTQKRKPKGRR